ncbi:hypothetical protein [Oribacterium sp. WCC10]|uniref:hypothetical protein n=1 Tax=Oribacterium sp. WCC10 TaxID=1855343 RepID=UPI0008E1FDEE|nr:hypothetical protein [Oribacterium sp. WCC10]SFG73453.1 hypothetical protein SAMN05216356_12230 [Oribacterium sp. WCC10]
MNEKQTRKFGSSGEKRNSGRKPDFNKNGHGKSSGKTKPSSRKTNSSSKGSGFGDKKPKPFYNTKLKGKKGAQQGDYVMISDGKKKVTTRINLPNHPFARKEVGDMVIIKGVEWYLIRIFQQGTAAYNKIYDEDTQREHFGY